MDTTEALKAACLEASDVATHIDAKIRNMLLKRARKQGMTDEGEVVALIEAWKRAVQHTKHLRTRED